MEELKQLIELVLKLPNTALWILAGYLAYKLAIVGSIYGTIKFTVEKLHSWATKSEVTVYTWKEGIEPISAEVKDSIINSLLRLKNCLSIRTTKYVHSNYAEVLEQIVNDYISSGQAKK